MTTLNTDVIDPSWQPLVFSALRAVNPRYLAQLEQTNDWLPGPQAIFNAFRLPLSHTQFILLGESPYPRPESANGFAFWDARVTTLWSATGLDAHVNRATSLRNMLKTMLVAEKKLCLNDLSQEAIAQLDKTHYIKTGKALFENFMRAGVLLLNASLVLGQGSVKENARQWRPFIQKLLEILLKNAQPVTLILFGNIAKEILALPCSTAFPQIVTEHPYNLSFIRNPRAIALFQRLKLLAAPDVAFQFPNKPLPTSPLILHD